MKPIQQAFRLRGKAFYEKHLAIVSNLLPTNLTQKEIEVLACFLSLDKVIIEEDMFNTIARKKVMGELKLQAGGLGNHLKSMITKGVLVKHKITNKITIREFLLPQEPIQGYQIKLVKE